MVDYLAVAAGQQGRPGRGLGFAVVSTASAAVWDVDLSGLETAVGAGAFERGREYARGGRVLRIKWAADGEELTGSVVGSGGLYATSAFFARDDDGALVFEEGECTCPVGYDCKHVAALVIVSAGTRVPGRAPQVARALRVSGWEKPLRALIDAPAAQAAGNPLAIELSLSQAKSNLAGRGSPRLMAGLLRAGARGGWVNGSLKWGGLDSWHVRDGGFRSDHLALVRNLHALERARDGQQSSWYSYGADKTLDLSDCGPHLWGLLDEAALVGLPLLDARSGVVELPRYRRAEIVLDVTREAGTARAFVRAELRTEGEGLDGLEPVLFLGAS
ncbi:MAG: SWIM zinc finger family protein, partial [Nitrososphaerales archaeon]